MEEESFEVQAKIDIDDLSPILEALKKPELEIVYQRHYHEYDTYFSFDGNSQPYLRYREDHFVNTQGEVEKVRSRLTLIGPEDEQEIGKRIIPLPQTVLSRLPPRASASTANTFKPKHETEIEKRSAAFSDTFPWHGILCQPGYQ